MRGSADGSARLLAFAFSQQELYTHNIYVNVLNIYIYIVLPFPPQPCLLLKSQVVLRSNATEAEKTLLNVILGKSPGATLRKFQGRAYGLGAQKNACKETFDRKFGKNKWYVDQWIVRDVSARTSKTWQTKLLDVCEKTHDAEGILATFSVCRMLRTKRDLVVLEDSGVRILLCEHEGLDLSTPTGKHLFGR